VNGPVRRLLQRPEAGAAAGLLLVWSVLALIAGPSFRSAAGTAAWLNAAAPLGILAVAVALLMIGGEFDLSVGSTLGAAGMLLMLLVTHFGWPLWIGVITTLAFCALVGLANGLLVVRTELPSFIVTLGSLFILRGATIGVSRTITGRTQLGGLDASPGYPLARWLFAGEPVPNFRSAILWWLVLATIATWVLQRTRSGNWIFATGANGDAARKAGVPTARVRIALFVTTALAAGIVAILQAVRFNGADVLRGEFQEFRAIVATVIGGTLLTGGYGSIIGACCGALVFGIIQQGIVMAGIDADWFQVALGAMLVLAVLSNNFLLSRAQR
jgi:simple sugar transport system permease protein